MTTTADPAPSHPTPPTPAWEAPTHPTHPVAHAWQKSEQGWGRDGKARVDSDQHRIFSRPIAEVWRTGPMTRRKRDA